MSKPLKLMKNDEFYLERTQRNQLFLGGIEGQKKLRELKVGVAGLGGMGSNIAEYLARVGVGSLNLADPDTIDISNINRQVIANVNTVGDKKINASSKEIHSIDEDIKIIKFNEGITKENVNEFVDGCDFIVDEIDVFPIEAHYILHKAAREKNIPIYSAYVIGLGIHFYKFHGNDYKFEDFINYQQSMNEEEILDEAVKKFINPAPIYLNNKNIKEFKTMASKEGVPIFGPSCLLGHSIVVTRILCDFLESNILGVEVTKTPIMPNFVKIDLSTLELSIHNVKKEAA